MPLCRFGKMVTEFSNMYENYCLNHHKKYVLYLGVSKLVMQNFSG